MKKIVLICTVLYYNCSCTQKYSKLSNIPFDDLSTTKRIHYQLHHVPKKFNAFYKKFTGHDLTMVNPKEPYNTTDLFPISNPNKQLIFYSTHKNNTRILYFKQFMGNNSINHCIIMKKNKYKLS